MPNPTILLADDDEVFLENATELLTANDYDVVCTRDPREAQELLQTRPFALAFLDVRFDDDDDRDESGLKVAQETINLSSVPKIILTKHDENTSYAIKALRPRHDGKTAAVDFVSKIEGLDRLLELLETHLNRAKIFLSYVREDRAPVNAIYEALSAVGFVPWIDTRGIEPGAEWKETISHQIKISDLFVVCISEKSFEQSGHFHKEIKEALEVYDELPPGQIYLVPIKLEECEITHPKLGDFQWLELFDYPISPASHDNFHRLVGAIKVAMRQRNELRR